MRNRRRLQVMGMMQAFVISEPGGPEKLQLKEIERPAVKPGWVLIRNRAFGLNRSEWFTRRGDSPSVEFPRVLGIECVGEVVAAADDDLTTGQTVAAMMGGMGRDFDGSYAEYVLVPRDIVFPIQSDLAWPMLAAMPEMLQTVHGSLYTGLEIGSAQNILIRGATSSIGFASIAVARSVGLEVTATTRDLVKADELRAAGAAHVIVDKGSIAAQAHSIYTAGFDRVLELIGTTTLLDSLQSARPGGIVCMTGILGGEWVIPEFAPMDAIPTGVKLTSYSGGASDITAAQLQHYVTLVEAGELKIRLGPRFVFTELQQAHALMDHNRANGKIVVTLDP